MGRDKDRPSWREVDRRREGGGARRDRDSRDAGSAAPTLAQRRYRQALDRAFDSGEIGKLVEKMNQARGGPRVEGVAPPAAPPPAPAPVTPVTPADAIAPADPVEASSAEEPPPRRSLSARGLDTGADRSDESQSRQKLLAKAKAAVGREEAQRAVDAYVRRHGWPADVEFLSLALEHRKGDVIAEALGRLEILVDRERPRRSGLLGARLRTLEELSDDSDLRDRAGKLRRKL